MEKDDWIADDFFIALHNLIKKPDKEEQNEKSKEENKEEAT